METGISRMSSGSPSQISRLRVSLSNTINSRL